MLRKVFWKTLSFILVMLAWEAAAAAQDPAQAEPQQSEPPAKSEAAQPKGIKSFIDDAFENPRHRFGFSLGAHEIYQNSRGLAGAQQNSAAGATFSASGRFFLNLGGRRSTFHSEYGIGYRRKFNQTDHYARIQYNLPLGRRTRMQLGDQISFSPYGYNSLMSPILEPMNSNNPFGYDILHVQQNIIRNFFNANLSHQVGRKGSLSILGSHQIYRFQLKDTANVNATQIGVNYGQQLTQWLSFSLGFSSCLNKTGPISSNATIYNLQLAGLNFTLGKSWQVSASGGFQYTSSGGADHLMGSGSAQLIWSSTSNAFHLSYNRGFSSAFGLPGVFQSQIATAGFGTRLTSWMNLQLSALYSWSNSLHGLGSLEYYHARAGLDFAIRRNLLASLAGLYQRQHMGNLLPQLLGRDRLVASVGLQYMFPSFRR